MLKNGDRREPKKFCQRGKNFWECNTRIDKNAQNRVEESRRNVLTYIKDMLTHINVICLHISVKSRKFAVEKERETNPS